MRLLFIIDPLPALNPKKDSTIALARAAVKRGDAVYGAEIQNLLCDNQSVYVGAEQLVIESGGRLEQVKDKGALLPACDFDVVFMRKEPPVDEDFVMATRLLDIVNLHTPVINAPRALRERNEKLAIFNFPDLIPPTWVGARLCEADAFRHHHQRAVLKPLNAMGGEGIYITDSNDLNFRSVFNVLSDNGKRLIMMQSYLPSAQQGDLRVFTVKDKVLPWMLARVPRADDYRGNLAAGGTPRAMALSATAKKIAETVAPVLWEQGIAFSGLDIIGDKLIEINITCPTGLCEVHDQSGENIAEIILDEATRISRA